MSGVSVRGDAIAGAVGVPFMAPYAGQGSAIHVMYGLAGWIYIYIYIYRERERERERERAVLSLVIGLVLG